jgi:hypothetical protein
LVGGTHVTTTSSRDKRSPHTEGTEHHIHARYALVALAVGASGDADERGE